MKTEVIDYYVDGKRYCGYLARQEGGGKRAGVLLAHEGPGLDRHAQLRTRRLAELGYTAFALDLHGEGYVAPTHEETMAACASLRFDREEVRRRVRGAYATMCALDSVDSARTAAVGYCIGGMVVLELARSGAPLLGVITMHGLLEPVLPPSPPNTIRPSVLVCTGAADHLIPREQITAFEQEMTTAGVDWQVLILGGAKHAFTNHIEAERLKKLDFAYDERADRRSWAALCSFLDETFTRGAVQS